MKTTYLHHLIFTNIATLCFAGYIIFAAKKMKKTITFSKAGTSFIARKLQRKENYILKSFFITAGATANEENGFYTLNGINDITEEEMFAIYMHKDAVDNLDLPHALQGCGIRSIIPCRQAVGLRLKNRPLNGENSFAGSSVEVLKFGNGQELDCTEGSELLPASGLNGTFCGCTKLHTVYPINIKEVSSVTDNTFEGCAALRELRLHGLRCSIKLTHSPLISYKSLLYIVLNSCEGAEIVLHPTTYKYLITMEPAPTAVGGTDNEWIELQEIAAGKNVLFTTTENIAYAKDDTMYINYIDGNEESLILDEDNAVVNGTTMILIN